MLSRLTAIVAVPVAAVLFAAQAAATAMPHHPNKKPAHAFRSGARPASKPPTAQPEPSPRPAVM